jgi:hypothetical protein
MSTITGIRIFAAITDILASRIAYFCSYFYDFSIRYWNCSAGCFLLFILSDKILTHIPDKNSTLG